MDTLNIHIGAYAAFDMDRPLFFGVLWRTSRVPAKALAQKPAIAPHIEANASDKCAPIQVLFLARPLSLLNIDDCLPGRHVEFKLASFIAFGVGVIVIFWFILLGL